MSRAFPFGISAALLCTALALSGCSDSESIAQNPQQPSEPPRPDRQDDTGVPRATRDVEALLAEARANPRPIRVLVHLFGYDEERRLLTRSRTNEANAAEEKQEREVFRTGQDALLGTLSPGARASAMRLQSLPYLAFDATESDLAALTKRVKAGRHGLEWSTDNWVGVIVERVPSLRMSAAKAGPSATDTPLADVVARVVGSTTMTAPSSRSLSRRIVVIDDPVDHRYVQLVDRVTMRRRILNSYPQPAAIEDLGLDPSGTPKTKLGHGSQVALAAVAVAPEASILSLAVDDGAEGYPFDRVLAAMDWVHHELGAGKFVDAVTICVADEQQTTSSSCGDSSNHAMAFASLTALLGADDIAVVVAAGNNGRTFGEVFFPACITTSVTVSALDASTNDYADFSNWSELADVAAPGTSMTLQALPAGYDLSSLGPGTSVAAPLVAGALCRLRAIHPGKKSSQLVEALTKTPNSCSYKSITTPRLDVEAASKYLDSHP